MSEIRIPETDGVSGTWAALERTSPIVEATDGVPTTTSMRVANGTHNEHRAVLQLIRDNMADFNEFGGVAFQMQPFDTPGGVQQRSVAILNEDHATLLLTYMRNNEIVKDFKKRLVREFSALRKSVSEPVMPTHAQALRGWAEQLERAEIAESQVRELTPSASAWNELAEAAGDYGVADAAKILSRDANIATGRDRLFAYMQSLKWVYRDGGRWRAYQSQVDLGRLTEKVAKPFVRDGQMVNGEPTVRVTARGLRDLHQKLGGTQQLSLMGSVS